MEANKKTYKFAFWILITIGVIYILNVFRMYPFRHDVPFLNPILKPIVLNVDANRTMNNSLFCYQGYCTSPYSDNFNRIYYYKFNPKDEHFYDKITKNIYITYPKDGVDVSQGIKSIDLHVGNDNTYYTKEDISKFERKTFKIELEDGETKEYTALILPKINNCNGIINHILSCFLSLFYNWHMFLVAYIWFFVAFLIYIFNKDSFNFKFDPKNPLPWLGLIILLALIYRINGIIYFPLSSDEIYTQSIAIENFKSIFKDAGNPPLFYFMEYIFSKILFSTSNLAVRIFPLLCGLGLIPFVYLIFKNQGEKIALFASFLASINAVFIYQSQEARCYSLCMLLCATAVYFLFKYLKNPTTKNLIYYAICAILLINCNYYLILFVGANFLWAIVDLIENKNRDKILKFAGANVLAGLTFLPYLILSYKTAMSDTFNGWIPRLSKDMFEYTICQYFSGKYIFLILCFVLLFNIILCYIPKIKKNLERENLFIYLVYTMTLIVIMVCAISIFIKPIFHKRLFLSVYSLLFLIEVIVILSVVEFEKFNKFALSLKTLYSIIVLALYFFVTTPLSMREACNLWGLINLVKNEAPIYHAQGYEINVILPDYSGYLKSYPEVNKLDYIKWHVENVNSGKMIKKVEKETYTKTKNKVVIYYSAIGIPTSIFNPKTQVYRNNLTHISRKVYE